MANGAKQSKRLFFRFTRVYITFFRLPRSFFWCLLIFPLCFFFGWWRSIKRTEFGGWIFISYSSPVLIGRIAPVVSFIFLGGFFNSTNFYLFLCRKWKDLQTCPKVFKLPGSEITANMLRINVSFNAPRVNHKFYKCNKSQIEF